MNRKLLARSGAAVFVGIAFAMTLVQLREEPVVSRPQPAPAVATRDTLPNTLRTCARLGEAALSAPHCLAAWAEKRRRFFGVDHPEAYADLSAEGLSAGSGAPAAAEPGAD